MVRRRGLGVGISIILVIAACSDSAEAPATTPPAPTTRSATTEPTGTIVTTTAPTSSTTSSPPTTSSSTTTTSGAGDDAPPAWDTWTLIYASLDIATSTREDALAIAASVADADVLLSDEYRSLNPGYWVVYAGEWHSRFEAGNWCPPDLDPGLSCYPRYLGDTVETLLTASSAVMEIDGALVIFDTASQEVTRVVTNWFGHQDGSYPGSFALDRDHGRLYFSRGYEDSWYSCNSERGSVEKLDLETGDAEAFADGWSTTISPDGRWLALVAASRCVPDTGNSEWFMAPGDTVEIYDLESGSATPSYKLTVQTKPVDYSDPNQVGAVFWDADSKTLLVGLGDGTLRRVRFDSGADPTRAPIEVENEGPRVVAVTASDIYTSDYLFDVGVILSVLDRDSRAVLGSREIEDGWLSVTVNGNGDVLLGTSDRLILPSGTVIPVDGFVYNVAW